MGYLRRWMEKQRHGVDMRWYLRMASIWADKNHVGQPRVRRKVGALIVDREDKMIISRTATTARRRVSRTSGRTTRAALKWFKKEV